MDAPVGAAGQPNDSVSGGGEVSCIGNAWCPECREIIYGNGCMCGLTCDRGSPRHKCSQDAPDGIWPRRMYGQPAPSSMCETKNGWMVRWTFTMDGEWQPYQEPYDAIKSPGQLRWESLGLGRPISGDYDALSRFTRLNNFWSPGQWSPGQTGILVKLDNEYLTTGAGI